MERLCASTRWRSAVITSNDLDRKVRPVGEALARDPADRKLQHQFQLLKQATKAQIFAKNISSLWCFLPVSITEAGHKKAQSVAKSISSFVTFVPFCG
jgi:hypothetical protein